MNKPKNAQTKTFKRLTPFIKNHIFLLISCIICILGQVTLDMFLAQSLKILTDSAINKNNEKLKYYIPIILILIASELIVTFFSTYTSGKFSESCLYDIRLKTFTSIKALPLEYLDKHPSGDLVSRATSDLSIIQGFLRNTLGNMLAIPVRVTVATIFIFLISWKLTVFSLILTPLLLLLTMIISKPIEKNTKKQQEELGKVNALAQDSISGLIITKSFTLEDLMKKKYDEAVDKSVQKGLKSALYSSFSTPISLCLQLFPFILIFAYGGYLGVKGEITFGSLLAFIQAINYVVKPLTEIPNIINNFRKASAGVERVSEIWDEIKEKNTGETYNKNLNKTNDNIAISFKNVSFGYEKDNNILNNLSFNIKEGEKVALVGHSGCGKSTIFKLITGFYEANTGNIEIYGHSLKKWNLDAVREHMALVSQDNYLFPEDIYTNISYGKKNACKEDIEKAAESANIKDFIDELPEKYNTIVGERGVKLSGGQKQRIAIARAFLKTSSILMLDESTSALDAESEQEVQKALEVLWKDKTTLVISHRLSTIKNVDRILVMDEGQIVEEGTFEELLSKDTLYSKLYSAQFSKVV